MAVPVNTALNDAEESEARMSDRHEEVAAKCAQCGMLTPTEAEVFLHEQAHADAASGADRFKSLIELPFVMFPRIGRLMDDFRRAYGAAAPASEQREMPTENGRYELREGKWERIDPAPPDERLREAIEQGIGRCDNFIRGLQESDNVGVMVMVDAIRADLVEARQALAPTQER
jgi:hypothetical protein